MNKMNEINYVAGLNTGITIGLNIEFLALVLLGIFLLYFLGMVLMNTYINLTAKDLGRLFVVVYMLGVLTVAYMVGSQIFIYISLIVMIITMLFAVFRLRGKSKKSRVASQQRSNN